MTFPTMVRRTNNTSESLHGEILRLLRHVSDSILPFFYNRNYTVTEKGKAGPLTEADLLANDLITACLENMTPSFAILSEETLDDQKRLNYKNLWVIDPIDGTSAFVAGRAEFSVSIGLACEGQAIFGAIAMPAENKMIVSDLSAFTVRKQGEAENTLAPPASYLLESIGSRDGQLKKNLHVTSTTDLNTARVLVSSTEYKQGVVNCLKEHGLQLQPESSVARKMAYIASGRDDLLVSLKPKSEWDICAGVALIEQAGGIVLDLKDKKPFRFNEKDPVRYGLVAGNKNLVEQYLNFHENHQIPVFESY